MKVLLFDDLVRDWESFRNEVLSFLGLDAAKAPQAPVWENRSGLPRSQAIQTLIGRSNPLRSLLRVTVPQGARERIRGEISRRNTQRPNLKPSTRRRLQNVYKDDVLELQDMLGRDFSAWLG